MEFKPGIHNRRASWWLSGKEPACQCRRHRFNPWVGKTDLLEKEVATYSSILSWEIPRTEECLVGYSPWVAKELDTI